MTAIEDHCVTRESIMVVDDNPANLKLLEDMLQQKGYHVRSFPGGRLALAAVEANPPDLILLDVNMPEMNGYEVCSRLRANEELSSIPVLFLSALNHLQDKIRGFQSGGMDYISKPFQFEEVYARVEIHLKLRRAQRAEQELLEQTLNGAIRMLTNLVHAASPELAARSRAIRDSVAWIFQKLDLPDAWQYDLAATLCLIGCVTLPDEVFKHGYAGQFASSAEEEMFRAHPKSAARLLMDIPRLEPIAEMIEMQQTPELINPNAPENVKLGARMLYVAVEFDRRVCRGVAPSSALRALQGENGRADFAMVKALQDYSPGPIDFHREALKIKQLFAGMTLEEDVVGESTGIPIFRKETVLTETWIERLGNFAKSQGIKEPLRVRVPGQRSAPLFRGPLRRSTQGKLETVS